MARRSGFTLVEVLAVLAIMGIAAAMAAPSLGAYVRRQRVRGALDLLAGDVQYARMLAVRNGRPAVLRWERAPECAWAGLRGGYRYSVGLRGAPPGAAKRATIRPAGGPVCVHMNGGDSLVFNSRGLLVSFSNRTVWAKEGRVQDSLTISVMGRVLRRY
ncbi:MAG TPA: GspH/FimT family pseudopilin [Longimicrobiaceae bacterium]|nr:GspH/FimT family pseudopilin [Longimicrobiaceae bacterium]